MRAFFGCAVPGPRTSTTWPSTSGWTAYATDSRHSTVATKQLLETGAHRKIIIIIIQQATGSEHNLLRRCAANRFAAVAHGATMTAGVPRQTYRRVSMLRVNLRLKPFI
jgi:hypothetical protein